MMKRKMMLVALSAAVVMGGLFGSGAALAKRGADDGVNTVQVTSQAKAGKKIGVAKAKQNALKVVSGKVRSVELEREHGVLYYKVKIIKSGKRYEILVNAYSGKTIVKKAGKRDDD